MHWKVSLNALTNAVVILLGVLISVCSVLIVIRYIVDLETVVVDVVGVGAGRICWFINIYYYTIIK